MINQSAAIRDASNRARGLSAHLSKLCQDEAHHETLPDKLLIESLTRCSEQLVEISEQLKRFIVRRNEKQKNRVRSA